MPYQPSTTCGPDTPRPRMKRPPREVVHRHRGHRGGGRLARGHLHDRGAEPHVLRLRAPPGERRQHVGAVGLRRPDRVEAEPVGLGDRLLDAGRRARAPVAGVEAELEVARHRAQDPIAVATLGAMPPGRASPRRFGDAALVIAVAVVAAALTACGSSSSPEQKRSVAVRIDGAERAGRASPRARPRASAGCRAARDSRKGGACSSSTATTSSAPTG